MKKILTVLMIALLLTAFAIPQDKQETPEPTKYAVERADLIVAYNLLIEQRTKINEKLDNIVFTVNWMVEREKQEALALEAEPDAEESK